MKSRVCNGVNAVEVDRALRGSLEEALAIVEGAWGAELVIVPVAMLSPEFFALRTGLAGAFIQKLVDYRLRVAFVGDLSAYTEQSKPLRDFVRESNKRGVVFFVNDEAELPTFST